MDKVISLLHSECSIFEYPIFAAKPFNKSQLV